MEAAKIDWKNTESVFVMDQLFENINAPQWVDFLASPSSSSPVQDDVAWFCRPDCKHPSTAEDYLKSTPSSSKLLRSVSVSKLIGLADWTRSTNLKRRGAGNQLSGVANEDSENENPPTPVPGSQNENTKSCGEKDEYSESDEKPKDLFSGKDLFGKITDFCNELKKITTATSARVKEIEEEDQQQHHGQSKPLLGPKERKPLLEVQFQASPAQKTIARPKLRKNNLRDDEAENIPISLDLNSIKRDPKIRTNPPTPQGFSAPLKATPSKVPKSKLVEREIFQELGQKNTLREELDSGNPSLLDAKQGRTLDVFWFLKPCTLSS